MTISKKSGTVNFLRNINGSGNYAYPIVVSDIVGEASIINSEVFDGDNDMDLIVITKTENQILFFRNNGDAISKSLG